MVNKDIVKAVMSISAAKVVWQEIGRDFKLGDNALGNVDIISKIGRLSFKATAAYLTIVLTDAVVDSFYKSVEKAKKDVDNVEINNENADSEYFEEDVSDEHCES